MSVNNTLIFTATYNEVENISKFIEKIISQKLNADIYIIDDNSPDNTSEMFAPVAGLKTRVLALQLFETYFPFIKCCIFFIFFLIN